MWQRMMMMMSERMMMMIMREGMMIMTASQYNHSFGFQKPMKVKVVK